MNDKINKIGETLSRYGITQWGTCSFKDVLPLLNCRAAERIPQNAKSVIVCLFPYRLENYPAKRSLSKYAVVKDYHTVTAEILKPAADKLRSLFGGEYAVFADNSPIREVHAAAVSGLGVIGQNGLLINPEFGSYVFIGEIVTSLEIECAPSPIKNCIMCGECMRKCPGHAISDKGIDVLHCLSNMTQKKGELSKEEESLIAKNGLVWGCDICSDVCPMNKKTKILPLPQFLEDISFDADLSLTSKQLKAKAYGFRGKKVLERNCDILNSV